MFTFSGLKAVKSKYVATQHESGRHQMKLLPLSVLAAIVMAFSSLGAQADEASTLSQAELGKLFPGSFQAVVSGAVVVKITARGNGTLIGEMTGQEDRGRWSVKSGKLCIVWSNWLNGKASCSRVIADDGWYRGNGVKFRKI
jgi:hypothetical protein